MTPYLQDFHLFAPDMPGRGLSDRFAYHRTDVRTHGATVIEALLDVLGLDRVVLVGSSFGAYRALAFAHESPERVAALCLFGSPALVLDNRELPIQARLLGLPGVGRLLLKISTEKQERISWQVFSGKQAVQRLLCLLLSGREAPWVGAYDRFLVRAADYPAWLATVAVMDDQRT